MEGENIFILFLEVYFLFVSCILLLGSSLYATLPPMSSLLLHGALLVSGGVESREDVLVEDGIVKEIAKYIEEYDEEMDLTGKVLLPGLIDCHVHFREPGLEHKATMATESASAIAGGVTTVCEMPNTIPPTVTVSALADKVRRADALEETRNKIQETNVDMRFFFGITQNIHLATLIELFESSADESRRLRARIAGVKIYLDHSTGDQKIEDALLDDVFAMCAKHHITLVAHCEDPEENAKAAAQNTRTNIAAHSLIRPATSEVIAIEKAIALAKKHGTHFHVAHLSTEGGVDLVRKAKAEGLHITCEVAPHHLFLTTDDYERLGTLAKMNPPLRSHKHRLALWAGIADKTVDCISTDHAPHTLEEKNNAEPLKAPSGVPGVETMLPLLLSVALGHWPHPTEKISCPTLTFRDIVRLCFENPNRIFHLGKHDIEKGQRADIVIIDPNVEWTIEGKNLHSKCGWTSFEGWKVKGKVVRVIR